MGLLLIGSGAFLYYQTRGTTLWQDEWVWALYRRGNNVRTFLDPHNQHLSLVPLLIYRFLFATAGLGDNRPYRALVIGAHLVCVALLFVYASRRVGRVGGLGAAALILFLGPAWGNIIWPFQVAWLISLGAGLGALLMLDRADRKGDASACALLAISLASSGIGLVVMLGILLELVWDRRRRHELWVVALPGAIYVVWWVIYQQPGTLSKLRLLPRFVADEVASTIAALVGLAGNTQGASSGTLLSWGVPLALVAIVLLSWRLIRLKRAPPRVVALLTIAGSFWILTGLSRAFIGPVEAWASRYLYVGGLFVVMLAVELARGLSVPRPAVLLLVAAVVAAVVSNIGALRDGARYLRGQAQLTRAELGAMDITRSIVRPGYLSLIPNFPFPVVLAGRYFSAERAYGSPADSPGEIAAAPDDARKAADSELIAIHGVGLRSAQERCVTAPAAEPKTQHTAHDLRIVVPPTGLLLTAQGGPATVGITRFAKEFQVVGHVLPGARVTLRIGPDLAPQPWQMRLTGSGRVTACVLGPA